MAFGPMGKAMKGAVTGGLSTGPSDSSGIMGKMAQRAATGMPGRQQPGPFSAMPPANTVPQQNTPSGNIQGFQGINTGPSSGFASGPMGFLGQSGMMNPGMGMMMPQMQGPEGQSPNNFWQRYMQAMGPGSARFNV